MNELDQSGQHSEPATHADSSFRAPEALISGIFLGFVGLGLILLLLRASDIEWTWEYWGSSDGVFDKSVIFRNFGLLVLALIALPLAVWRSWVAQQQARIANKQHLLTEKGMIIDRFQKGAQMLESNELSVRFAGIYALRELAQSDPEETYIMVLDLLFDFVRERTKERRFIQPTVLKPNLGGIYSPVQPDVYKAINIACDLRDQTPESEKMESIAGWHPDLRGVNFSTLEFNEINLSNTLFGNAKLRETLFLGTNLSGASFESANCYKARFFGVNLQHAQFRGSSMRRAFVLTKFSKNIKMDVVDVSGARFTGSPISGSYPKKMWADADNMPINMHHDDRKQVAKKMRDETWMEFVSRLIQEQDYMGWTDMDRFRH